MPEYLCENCTVAYCFDDCNSPLAEKKMIEVEELGRCVKIDHNSEKSEKGIEDSEQPNNSDKKSPQAKLVGILD